MPGAPAKVTYVPCVLFFDWDARFPGRGKLVVLGESWGVRNARGIADEVFDSVATWQEVFADADVPADDCANFREMDTRLASAENGDDYGG